MTRAPALLGAAALTFVPLAAGGVQLDDPVNFQVIQTWTGTSVGVPGRLGALMFSDDGETLFVIGDSETATSAMYALDVHRDPSSQRVTGFGGATLVFEGDPTIPGLDAGLEVGPEGTLFYTYWDAHYIGERPVATSTVEAVFGMEMTGVPSSVAGLTFSPHFVDPATSFGHLQVSSWLGNGIYNVPLQPLGGGLFEPGTSTQWVGLPQQGTGAIQYIPQGLFTGNMMYVNWDFGEVRMLVIDRATGLPIDDDTGQPTLGTTNPRDIRFAYDIGRGPWGLEFDPRTLDFFVSTWSGTPSDSIIQFSGPGFANQAPFAQDQALETLMEVPLPITLTATDADMDPLTFTVATGPMNGALTGTTADVVYTPNAGFVGTDRFAFHASDGQLVSNTATITIVVHATAPPDAGFIDASRTDAGAPEDGASQVDTGAQLRDDATVGADAMPSAADAAARGVDAAAGGGTDDDCDCATAKSPARGSGLLWALSLLVVAGRRRER